MGEEERRAVVATAREAVEVTEANPHQEMEAKAGVVMEGEAARVAGEAVEAARDAQRWGAGR